MCLLHKRSHEASPLVTLGCAAQTWLRVIYASIKIINTGIVLLDFFHSASSLPSALFSPLC